MEEGKTGGLRRRTLIGGAVAAGAAGVLATVAVAGVGQQSTEKPPQKTFNPLEGEVVNLTSGRGLKSEVIARFPGEVEVQVAVQKILRASGTWNEGDQEGVDYFIPKEPVSNWKGQYIGYKEGTVIEDLGYKVEGVNPGKKTVTLSFTEQGKAGSITLALDSKDPNKKPDAFRDFKGNTYTFVTTLGRKSESAAGSKLAVIADRVVLYKEEPQK